MKISKLNLSVIAVIITMATASLMGCATALNSTKGETDWKTGWVHDIVDGKDLRDIQEQECVALLSSDQIMNSRFAVIWYIRGRRRIARTALIPSGMQLKAGDEVRIDIHDCAKAISLNIE